MEIPERTAGKVDYLEDRETGCWVWIRRFTQDGRADLNIKGRNVRAHRVYYERFVGPIPDGYHVHHKCENRACVNPNHLEAMPQSEHHQRHSRSPIPGVTWMETQQKWMVRIGPWESRIFVGHYKSVEKAEVAAVAAQRVWDALHDG